MQRYLNRLPYNTEPPPGGATLRSFRGVVRHGAAHCMEAALAAAVILEQHGYPPLILSFESIDELDHVLFVYRHRGRWGSVARSRDPGSARPQAGLPDTRAPSRSPTSSRTSTTRAESPATPSSNLRTLLGDYDWRLSEKNVWKAERVLLEAPHRPIRSSDARIDRLRRKYVAFRKAHEDRKPLYYKDRHTWSAIPKGNW